MKPLTPRQIEILKRIAVGETVKAVAIDLAVSPKTVEFHWAKVKEKLKISSHAEAAHYAIARLGVPLMFSLALAVTGCRSDRPVNINPATARASVPTNVVDSATFAWDASPSSGVTGYKFYQGAKSRGYTNSVKVGNVLTFTTTNLPAATNFFAVTAYDASGNETYFSNEVTRAATNSAPVLTNKVIGLWVETNSILSGTWGRDARFGSLRLTNATGPGLNFRVGFTNFYQ